MRPAPFSAADQPQRGALVLWRLNLVSVTLPVWAVLRSLASRISWALCPALPSLRRPHGLGCVSLEMGGLQKLAGGWRGGRGGEQTGGEEPRLLSGAEQQGGARGTLWVWAIDGELQALLPGAWGT